MSRAELDLSHRQANGVRPEQWAMVPVVMVGMFLVGLVGLYARGGPGSFGSAVVIASMLSVVGTASYVRELVLKSQRPARVVVRTEPGRHRR